MILILTTGGTFDKRYDEIKGELFFKETQVPEMLTLGRSGALTRVQSVMLKDSLDMTTEDRSVILDAIRKAPENQIVLTHGTDTMEVTARFLGKESLGKTIVLTGAMIPYAFGSSDGLFNLGSAIAFAQVLPAGVYIAMNGRYFHWDNVLKNRSLGIFEPKN